MLPNNKPYLTGKETDYIIHAVKEGKISGNGLYTSKCHQWFQDRYGFKKCLLTTSCTDALEMAAILVNIQPGDEVIVPSFTFVSTANAFVLRGAKIVFADSRSDHPGIDENRIEELITSKTKVIVPVHYAGVACDMGKIMELAKKYNLWVVEDAAQSINSFYKGNPLGGIGHLGCFSFHETKNIQCGEGGMLIVNETQFLRRAERIWEKGTNRVEFFRGEVNKYEWMDIGSSFLPADIIAAFLWAQLEEFDTIQKKRLKIWNWYERNIQDILKDYKFNKPIIPEYATNNAHMYYLLCDTPKERNRLISDLMKNGIHAISHYLSLHKSPFYINKHDGRKLENTIRYENCLVRLPFYLDIKIGEFTI